MFEHLLREIDDLKRGKSVSIPIKSDEDGYFDKECPNPDCLFKFKVKESKYKTDEFTCPMCGKKNSTDNFYTSEQVEYAKEQAFNYVSGRIHNALHDSASSFNRKQPNKGFIQISMNVTGPRVSTTILPINALKEIERKIKCNNCKSEYALIGSAYFCPSCGFNDIENTFADSIETIRFKINNADTVQKALANIDEDQARNTSRDLIESALGDIVTAFQRFMEFKYSEYTNISPKMNIFQKLIEGSQLWKDQLNQGYEDWISSSELIFLSIMFQRRHILEHKQGIVDQRYLDNTNDSEYTLGERLVINQSDLQKTLKLVEQLITKLRDSVK